MSETQTGTSLRGGVIMLFGLIGGNILASLILPHLSISGPLPEIGTRIFLIFLIVITLDRIFGVSRQWVPAALKQKLASITGQ